MNGSSLGRPTVAQLAVDVDLPGMANAFVDLPRDRHEQRRNRSTGSRLALRSVRGPLYLEQILEGRLRWQR